VAADLPNQQEQVLEVCSSAPPQAVPAQLQRDGQKVLRLIDDP